MQTLRVACEFQQDAFNDFLSMASGLPGGLVHATHSSNKSDIKREDKEEDENSSVADKSEEEKKESKPSRNRTRCKIALSIALN